MSVVLEVAHVDKKFFVSTTPLTFFNFCRRVLKVPGVYRELWALKNISFAIEQGDRVAVIGDNGAGKTTLLRILSGLYRQTNGSVRITGQTVTLLQMGTEIERNLTAYDNIFLFGSIIGIDRALLQQRLDEILSFAELGDFVHVPLRDYSAGMIQRLALSILRFTNADIYFLDELLTSGDIMFQDKCAALFAEYADQRKTLMMASHHPQLIRKFCTKALWIDKGIQRAFGPVNEIMDQYLARTGQRDR